MLMERVYCVNVMSWSLGMPATLMYVVYLPLILILRGRCSILLELFTHQDHTMPSRSAAKLHDVHGHSHNATIIGFVPRVSALCDRNAVMVG